MRTLLHEQQKTADRCGYKTVRALREAVRRDLTRGLSKTAIAGKLGVHRQTIRVWCRDWFEVRYVEKGEQ